MNYFIMIFYTVSLLHSHSVWCADQVSSADELAAFRQAVRKGGLWQIMAEFSGEEAGDPDLPKNVGRLRKLIGGPEDTTIAKNLKNLLELLGGEGSLTERLQEISDVLAREENTIRLQIRAIKDAIMNHERAGQVLERRVATLTQEVNAGSIRMMELGRENGSLRGLIETLQARVATLTEEVNAGAHRMTELGGENTLLRSWIVNLAGVLGYPSDLSRDALLREIGIDWSALKQLLNAGTSVKRAALGEVGKTVPGTTLPQLVAHLKAKTNGNNLKLLGMVP